MGETGAGIEAVFWDFGGVISASPFDAFARYERDNGLPDGFIRRLNSVNPDTNAWSQLERNAVGTDEFCGLFEAEAAAAGGTVDARVILGLLAGEIRPEMVEAVRRCSERLKTALLTNNFRRDDTVAHMGHEDILELFDVVVESRHSGVRKPDPEFYRLALEQVGVEPERVVFLDDLGINLKPARALGMTTIKVVDPSDALDQLEAAVGFPVRSPGRP
jgi:putative hydrolase of the HAD superfamily